MSKRGLNTKNRGITTNNRGLQVGTTIPQEGLKHHYDATQISASNGQSINEWQDQKGQSNLTQLDDAQKPSYSTSQFNSMPAVKHRGDHLSNTSISNGNGVSMPWRAFVVAKLDSRTSNYDALFDFVGDEQDAGAVYEHNGSNTWYGADGSGDYTSTGTSSDTNPHIFEIKYTSSNCYYYLDGTEILNIGSSGADSDEIWTGTRDSIRYDTDVDIGEIALYNENSVEVSKVREQLSDKWSISLS